MLWYKAWLETRWRFAIGLIILLLSACSIVIAYPEVRRLLVLMPQIDLSGEIGRRVAESAELARDYRGYVWSQWFVQNMPQQWALFAVLLGTGGLLAQATGGGALFTLSLPVSRNRLLGIRAATGLAELLVLAVVPALVLPLLSPVVGERYAVGDAIVHAACLFIAGSVFFSLTFLLSTVFRDVWRPALIVLCGAIVVALAEQVFRGASRIGLFRVMSAEAYFRGEGLPWVGLFVSAAVSAAALYAATRNMARRDF
jgi:ABC-2 type transport system permease protein